MQDEDEPSSETLKILVEIESWILRRDVIRARAIAWLRSPAFLTSYYDDAHVPFALKFALDSEARNGRMTQREAKQNWEGIQYLGQQSPQLWNQYQQLAIHGEVWLAVPLMVNPAFSEMLHTLLPCGVIVATAQQPREILLAGLYAQVAYAIYAGDGDKNERPGTARMMANDEYRLFYREQFPLKETAGESFMLLSVLMRKSWMPPKDIPIIPLLAIPGPNGAVVQIPWDVATGVPPLPGSMAPGRFADIAVIDRQADRMLEEHQRRRTSVLRIIWWLVAAGIVIGILTEFFGKL